MPLDSATVPAAVILVIIRHSLPLDYLSGKASKEEISQKTCHYHDIGWLMSSGIKTAGCFIQSLSCVHVVLKCID